MRFFYECNKMATDVDVQYFSHLNGLTLGNNWGDMIRLLDACLVNGLPLTSITSASIDAQGDIHLTTYAAHKSMLFQIVELSGFAPVELNAKYRIKGIPSANELILKAEHAGKSITTTGAAKLASLGYEIIFRDMNDVKRVYRAKNPRVEHPFIRIDESLTSPDGTTGVYTSTYAKFAMVGLLERMNHIDDYQNPDVLQLPLDITDFSKNWKISGNDGDCIRGWSRWYYARALDNTSNFLYNSTDESTPPQNNQQFTLIGDSDAFYLLAQTRSYGAYAQYKALYGVGLFNSSLKRDVIPSWFLMSNLTTRAPNFRLAPYNENIPLAQSDLCGYFNIPKYNLVNPIGDSQKSIAIMNDYYSGYSNKYFNNMVPAIEIPIADTNAYLRGSLKHICYAGKSHEIYGTTPMISDASMYVYDRCYTPDESNTRIGGFYFYLGEIE
mgnify:CR=1 FL=1